jgi:hypothetical protein
MSLLSRGAATDRSHWRKGLLLKSSLGAFVDQPRSRGLLARVQIQLKIRFGG